MNYCMLIEKGELANLGWSEGQLVSNYQGWCISVCGVFIRGLNKSLEGVELVVVEVEPCAGSIDRKCGRKYYSRDFKILKILDLWELETIQYLIYKGANIKASKYNVFRIAAALGRLDIVKELLRYEIDVHARSDFAIKMARERGHLDVVAYLESHSN